MSFDSFNPAPLKPRMRLFVIQVLVFSLMFTLLARLWYMQVMSSDDYSQAATQNHTREVLIPAPRGQIVDALGRPLVGNRVSLVITVDRSVLAKLPDKQQQAVLARLAKVLGQKPKDLTARTMLCGEPGASKPPACWNGTPYQPIPVAKDVTEQIAIEVMERREDFPGVAAESATLRNYSSPFGVNAAHILGYLSPITTEELDKLDKAGQDSVPHRSDLVGRAGVERTYDQLLRGTPGVKNVIVDAVGYTTGIQKQTAPVPGSTLVTSIDARIQASVEAQLRGAILTARKQYDKITKRKYEADSGAAVVMDTKTGQIVAMASYPSYDPGVWVGGISQRELDDALLDEVRYSAGVAGVAGPAGTRIDVQADHHRGRDEQRVRREDPAGLLVVLRGRQPQVQELRVGVLRDDRLRPGARVVLRHLLLPDRLRPVAEGGRQLQRRQRGRPAGRDGEEVRPRQADRDRPAR